MPKGTKTTKEKYPEIKDIRSDLDSLKNNVVELTRHITQNGSEQTQELKSKAQDKINLLKAEGAKRTKLVEERVKDQPGKSMAIAFGAGLLASLFIARRK